MTSLWVNIISAHHWNCNYPISPCSGISSILHNSVIEVTKEGTEGAAATGIELVFFSASFAGEKEVIVDRPFIFVLEDTEHNIPLLVGRVVSPLV